MFDPFAIKKLKVESYLSLVIAQTFLFCFFFFENGSNSI